MPPRTVVQYVAPPVMSTRLGGETKYVDGYLDETAIHQLSVGADDTWADCELNPRQQTAVYGCLPVPRQGTNYADRDGRKILVKKIHIKGRILWNTAADSTDPLSTGLVRIVLVKDTRTNGVEVSAENVIGPGLGSDGNASLSGDAGAINLPSNPNGWGRYQILFDKTFKCPVKPVVWDATNSGKDETGVNVPFKISIKANCEMNFSASTGAVGSVVDNSFHLLCAAIGNSVQPKLSYYARTSFVG